ncbi:MAG: hypothetical protein LUE12_09465 [Ruminococcus sp.]|nr:hypothetical protein [Ruminococcus sp.]
MLGKLTVNNLKRTFKYIVPLFTIIAVFTCFGNQIFEFVASTTLWDNMSLVIVYFSSYFFSTIKKLFIAVLIGAGVFTFYNDFYGEDKGFMAMLPAKPSKHILSKTFCTVFWYFIMDIYFVLLNVLVHQTDEADQIYSSDFALDTSSGKLIFILDQLEIVLFVIFVQLALMMLISFTHNLMKKSKWCGAFVFFFLAMLVAVLTAAVYIFGYIVSNLFLESDYSDLFHIFKIIMLALSCIAAVVITSFCIGRQELL